MSTEGTRDQANKQKQSQSALAGGLLVAGIIGFFMIVGHVNDKQQSNTFRNPSSISARDAVRLYSDYPEDVSFSGWHDTAKAECGTATGTFGVQSGSVGFRHSRRFAYTGYGVTFEDDDRAEYEALCG